MKVKKEFKLPELTHEQVEQIVYFLYNCDYEDKINYDNLCCAHEAIDEGLVASTRLLKEAYGIKVEWPYQDEEDEE